MAKKTTPVVKKATAPKKAKKSKVSDKGGNESGDLGLQNPERIKRPRDRFGNRIGSRYAKANAVLMKTPKKMAVIMEEAGLEKSVYVHMNKMVAEGKIGKN